MKKLLSAILVSVSMFIPVYADNTAHTPSIVRLATTTSTENSGLLKTILPAFQKQSGYEVQVIAVGTGKALKMGRDGDVDVVLVHARSAEEQFVTAGYGEQRYDVMYNDFVMVGPRQDPASVKDTDTASDALKHIADTQAVFVSRGDDSGTHKKEQQLWESAQISPAGRWYREAGQGMGKVLQIAGEMDAYTLTDRGTWLAYKSKSPLKLVLEDDKALFNPYGIIAVSQQRYTDINKAGAQALIDWITSKEGQKMIGEFTINGQQLFTPSAGE